MSEKKAIATRDAYGEALVELAAEDERIVVLGADLTSSTRTLWFAQKYPDRFFDFGIAEQNMLNAAAGLSLVGKIPWVSTYSVFVAGRAWDQIRTTTCYSNLNVRMGGAHGGISVGPDGATHQALEDVATMRTLPNMTVIVPADYHETKKAVAWATNHGPQAVRCARYRHREDQQQGCCRSHRAGNPRVDEEPQRGPHLACGPAQAACTEAGQ